MLLRADHALAKDDPATALELSGSELSSDRLPPKRMTYALAQRANAYAEIGHAFDRDDAWLQAVHDFETVGARDPKNPYWPLYRGNVYIGLGAYPEALAAFKEVERLEGDWPFWGLTAQARLHRILGEYDQTLALLDRLDARYNGRTGMRAAFQRGVVLYEMGRFAEAADALTKGLKWQKDFPQAYIERACALAQLGRYRAALTDYSFGLVLQDYQFAGRREEPRLLATRARMDKELTTLKALMSGRETPPLAPSMLCRGFIEDLRRPRSPLL
jgi:tetratricopeptide (TPR) repeat protein